MKAYRRILAAAAVLCLLAAMLPGAFAARDERFDGKTWEQVTMEFLDRVKAMEQGMVAIGYYNTVSGEEQYLNPDEYITVGSVYKVPLNMIYCEKIANGEMQLDTPIFGIPYETLLRGTIIDSNNDYAKTLWDKLGSYRLYREMIAPYMGEDPQTVSWKFYENNFFTARQMITCLRTLYENPDRFPYLIDTMKEAEPNNYFHRDEHRFEVAHKYGYNNESYHYYVADSGIFYTTEPFLLVVLTDNTPQAFDVLAQYAVLMCDYNEYTASARIRDAAPERAVAELTLPSAPAVPSAEKGENAMAADAPLLDMDLTTFARLVGILALTVIGLGLCVKLARHAGYVTLIPAIIILAAGLLISRGLIRSSGAALFTVSRGNGQATVENFFTELEAGDYAAAVDLLDGYSALGVEGTPESPETARVYEAVRSSYAHSLISGSSQDNDASYTVNFRHLYVDALTKDVAEETKNILKTYVAERPEEEVFDENIQIREEVLAEAYAQAFDTVMGSLEQYYREDEFTLALKYGLKGWMIQPNQDLMQAICGGSASA
ncbi:MAG: hypothetical protein Q4E38_02870 [Eubacteriales bacterium]|nr:hypothetical protein [Eubacteriales bacterium]